MLRQARQSSREVLVRAMWGRMAASNARRRASPSDVARRILVVRPDHIGDLLFATPALALLRRAFPAARITGAVGPWGRAVWEGNPDLDALHVIRFPGITERSTRRPLAPYRMIGSVARHLAREEYDLGILLRFDHWWGAALLWAAGIPRRWGYDTPGMDGWLTGRASYVPGRHEVEQNLRLIEALVAAGVAGTEGRHLLPITIDRNRGEPPLRPPFPHPLPGGVATTWLESPRPAIIHPGTGAANKLWTISGWAEVADRLSAEGWTVALTGSPSERPLTTAIAEASQSHPLNLAGQTADLGQLMWLLSRAGIVLGVDSGPLHLAEALGKPTLHLYGPSDEAIWGPWGDPALHRAFRAPGTNPTMHLDVLSHDLEGGPDMRAITVEMVMGQVRTLLTRMQQESNRP